MSLKVIGYGTCIVEDGFLRLYEIKNSNNPGYYLLYGFAMISCEIGAIKLGSKETTNEFFKL